MSNYFKEFEVLWVDLDLNGHLGHTAYSRYANNVRAAFFTDLFKVTPENFTEQNIGPIVIREFIEYKREVRLNAKIIIDMAIAGLSRDYSRWVICHHVYINGKVACIINMEGAWLNLKLRKMISPIEHIKGGIDKVPKTKNFKIIGQRDRLKMTF